MTDRRSRRRGEPEILRVENPDLRTGRSPASLAMTSSPVASVTTMGIILERAGPVGATNPYRWGAFAISAEAMSFGT